MVLPPISNAAQSQPTQEENLHPDRQFQVQSNVTTLSMLALNGEQTHIYTTPDGQPMPNLPMMVEGECVVAAVDSWAGRCFVDKEVAEQLSLNNGPVIKANSDNWKVKLGAKNGDSCTLEIFGTILLECRVGSHGEFQRFIQEFLVLQDKAGPAFTLGLDWMKKANAMVGVTNIEFTDANRRITLPFVSEQDADNWIDTTKIHQMAILNEQERWHIFGKMCIDPSSMLDPEEVKTERPVSWTSSTYRESNSLRLHSSVIGANSLDFGNTLTQYLSKEQERGPSSASTTHHSRKPSVMRSSALCSIL